VRTEWQAEVMNDTVTLVLRRRADLPAPQGGPGRIYLTSAQLGAAHGADPDDLAAVVAAAGRLGLSVVDQHAPSRRVWVSGPEELLDRLFDTSGEPPQELAAYVTAALGRTPGPVARPHFKVSAAEQVELSYTPLQVAQAYDFPAGTDGAGGTVAIIELGGGYAQSDLTTYFAGLSLAVPSVTAVGIDGASNVAGGAPGGADVEVLLDIEVAGAVAPAADLVAYFAPNTDQGFVDSVSTAAHASPAPTAMSISWGGEEDGWTPAARTALDDALADAAALGVTVTVAAGDSGSADGATGRHVDFPASSPHVLACGGTRLTAAFGPNGATVSAEAVWNDGTAGATGGGVSDAFPVPAWQSAARVSGAALTGRGVPDVAGDADPQTGYQVFADGTAQVVGGTSAVAPLWAGLLVRCAQSLGAPLGLVNATLYRGLTPTATVAGFRDITSGTNGAYDATPGWDACTGLGVPVGQALLTALRTASNPSD
jgi:kumamolisin